MDIIQKTALKETAKTLAGLTAIAVLVPAAIFLIPLPVLGGIICVAAIVMAAKLIYDTKLDQAKFEAQYLDKKVDQ
jgi:MFS superfamily sulfate permease-like transporter